MRRDVAETLYASWVDGLGTVMLYDSSGNAVEITNPDLLEALSESVPADQTVSVQRTILNEESARYIVNGLYQDGIYDGELSAADIVGHGHTEAMTTTFGKRGDLVYGTRGKLLVKTTRGNSRFRTTLTTPCSSAIVEKMCRRLVSRISA